MIHAMEEKTDATTMHSVAETVRQTGLSASTIRTITKGREGRFDYLPPGSKKPIIRISQKLIDELLRQASSAARRR